MFVINLYFIRLIIIVSKITLWREQKELFPHHRPLNCVPDNDNDDGRLI